MFKRFLRRVWNRLRPKQQSEPAPAPDPAELRRAQLRRILYSLDVLAYDTPTQQERIVFIPTPCLECMERAINIATWQAELENELSALSHKPPKTADQSGEPQWEVTAIEIN